MDLVNNANLSEFLHKLIVFKGRKDPRSKFRAKLYVIYTPDKILYFVAEKFVKRQGKVVFRKQF